MRSNRDFKAYAFAVGMASLATLVICWGFKLGNREAFSIGIVSGIVFAAWAIIIFETKEF